MFMAILVTIEAVELGAASEASGISDDDGQHKARQSYLMLMAAMVAWGICGGVTNGPAQALFADALPERLRTEGYTYLFGVYLVASSLGPLITIIMFNRLSDQYEDWNLREIRPVFLAGIVLEILVAIIMLFFRDQKAVDDEEREAQETLASANSQDGVAPELGDAGPVPPVAEPVYDRKIPSILFLSSLITALGSGASVKFFPLFFKDAGLSPQQVQWIFVFSPLCIAAFTVVAKQVAERIGRIKATIIFESTGSLLLMLMSFLHHRGVSNPWLMIPIYLLRTSFMNCTYALCESVLMSAVPSNERSRWKSLESIAAFSWTGSAVVGGVLSDARGYAFAFGITAVVQLLGTWILFPLDAIVQEEELREREKAMEASANASAASRATDIEQPLLQATRESQVVEPL